MIVVIAATLGGDSGNGGRDSAPAGKATQGKATKRNIPKSYVVQNGDTLTSIAHRIGVPVVRILRLNPGIDPQILISGETLKLR